ncbi:MAG: TolC family protein, partial [bacterium]
LAVRGQRDDLPTLNVTTPNQRDSASGSAGVDIPLRTGGRVSVDLTESWSQTPNPFVSLDESFSSGLGVSISQPLLRNAGERVNTASIAIAGYNQQIAEARTTNRVIAEIASGERAYWRVYAAARELEVRQKQYELAVEQLERARRRVSAGQSPEVEVTRAESGVAAQLEAIIVAENTLLDQQRELKRRMNLPEADIAGTTLISPATQPNPLRYDLTGSKERLCDAALVNRAELLEAELAVLADAVNVDVARNAALPDVSLSASYDLAGLDRTFWLSQRRLSNANNDTWNAGVTAAIPLGNEAAEARLRRAIITRVQSIADKAAREQTVRQEVLGAIDRMNSGWQRILAARQNALLAARTLAAEQRQFDVGSRTSTDVLDAATRLADAQSAEIRALADYEVAKIDLAVATGTVLGASAVGWEAQGE